MSTFLVKIQKSFPTTTKRTTTNKPFLRPRQRSLAVKNTKHRKWYLLGGILAMFHQFCQYTGVKNSTRFINTLWIPLNSWTRWCDFYYFHGIFWYIAISSVQSKERFITSFMNTIFHDLLRLCMTITYLCILRDLWKSVGGRDWRCTWMMYESTYSYFSLKPFSLHNQESFCYIEWSPFCSAYP